MNFGRIITACKIPYLLCRSHGDVFLFAQVHITRHPEPLRVNRNLLSRQLLVEIGVASTEVSRFVPSHASAFRTSRRFPVDAFTRGMPRYDGSSSSTLNSPQLRAPTPGHSIPSRPPDRKDTYRTFSPRPTSIRCLPQAI